MSKDDTGHHSNLKWHPAFIEAIQLELEDYHDVLEFFPEYQLTAEPLRIDCVVIKKAKNAVIKKNIAAIFRDWNLLEYKSPGDYVAVNDFYKVYGYACLYASLENVPITGLTISFVESHYPQKLLSHFTKVRKYAVEQTGLGIYTIKGDILPIQVIYSRQLPAEENLWLKSLSDELDISALRQITDEIDRQGKAARVAAYFDAIAHANAEIIEEAIQMGKKKTLEQVLEEAGWLARWEARGEERKGLSIAQNMINMGLPLETVVSATQLDPEKVRSLYQR